MLSKVKRKPCAAVCVKEYDIPSIKAHQCLHEMTLFVQSIYFKMRSIYMKEIWTYFSQGLTAVQIDKGGLHFFERNIDSFSRIRRATAVQGSVKEVKEFLEGGQNYDTKESFKEPF